MPKGRQAISQSFKEMGICSVTYIMNRDYALSVKQRKYICQANRLVLIFYKKVSIINPLQPQPGLVALS